MTADSQAILLLGPTASGKTALALRLAAEIPSEIISIDSALVYRHMDIGTAKPTKEELAAVPHHLIDIIEPTESYSAAEFAGDCVRLVGEIRSRGRVPLIVGGTMLYAKAVREGLSPLPSTDPVVREKIGAELSEKGLPALYDLLKTIDPKTAERLAPADTQRITRALEVFEMTGKPLSEFTAQKGEPLLKLSTFALLPPNRAVLHEKIAERFEQMIQNGFLNEVKGLMKMPGMHSDLPSMRSVGYRQAWNYLSGMTSFDSFKEAGIAATRQLAKRQMTWMRSMQETLLLNPEEQESTLNTVKKEAEQILLGLRKKS